jgi:hypothetical protein
MARAGGDADLYELIPFGQSREIKLAWGICCHPFGEDHLTRWLGTMFLRVTTLIAAASAAAAIGSAAPAAHADTPDQQFLNLVHSNGVGGQDDTLITYAHEFCTINGWLPSGPALYGQGAWPGQLYIVQTAPRAECLSWRQFATEKYQLRDVVKSPATPRC